jgi:hypothetical protein
MKRTISVVSLAVISQMFSGCSDDNEVDRTLDCGELCDRYSDCVTDIDVTECTDHCEDQADIHPNIEQAVDTCEDCLDDRSCSEQAACVSSCELVPVPR